MAALVTTFNSRTDVPPRLLTTRTTLSPEGTMKTNNIITTAPTNPRIKINSWLLQLCLVHVLDIVLSEQLSCILKVWI